MYQEQGPLDTENFANFSFPQNDDINASLPMDTIIPQAPPTDARAATDFYETITTLIEDLQKFQESLNIIHNLLSHPLLDELTVEHQNGSRLQRLRNDD
jgi:hypothetical protein